MVLGLDLDLDLPRFQFTSAKLKAILVGKWIKMKHKSLRGEMGKVSNSLKKKQQAAKQLRYFRGCLFELEIFVIKNSKNNRW